MSGAIGRLYRDGQVLSSTQTYTSIGNWYDPAQEVVIGRLGSSYESGLATPFSLVVAWDRALSDAEVAAISANPWQLFRADPVRIYSLPSGPIGISWSSLTASGITPTTATLTLGGIVR